jgi:hypothetical protein
MIKSIVCTYPDFRELPKGLKQMLLASENLFFSEAQTAPLKTSVRQVGTNYLWSPSPQRLSADGSIAFSA